MDRDETLLLLLPLLLLFLLIIFLVLLRQSLPQYVCATMLTSPLSRFLPPSLPPIH